MPLTGFIGTDPKDVPLARQALEVLHRHYPGHSWFVRVFGGTLLVYNYQVDVRHCMVRHLSQISGDYTTFSEDLVRAAGELLERAKLRRGRVIEGEVARSVDGVHPRLHRSLIPKVWTGGN